MDEATSYRPGVCWALAQLPINEVIDGRCWFSLSVFVISLHGFNAVKSTRLVVAVQGPAGAIFDLSHGQPVSAIICIAIRTPSARPSRRCHSLNSTSLLPHAFSASWSNSAARASSRAYRSTSIRSPPLVPRTVADSVQYPAQPMIASHSAPHSFAPASVGRSPIIVRSVNQKSMGMTLASRSNLSKGLTRLAASVRIIFQRPRPGCN